jgi:FtsP/CotA-like multicopper oxidase with cupredoxin domain
VEEAQQPAGETREPGGITRRTWLGWGGGWMLAAAGGGVTWGLASCGGGGSSSSGGTAQPTAVTGPDPVVLDRPAAATISIQSRQAEWVVGKPPAAANAWVFVADATMPAAGILGTPHGPTFEMRRGVPCTVTWRNTIGRSASTPARLDDPPINVPLDLGQCGRVVTQSPVGFAIHLHGARVQGPADGWPLTPISFAGNPYGFPLTTDFLYPNAQRGTLLWYHDHAMDRVGRHVHAGLAGAYVIRDAADDALLALIGGRSRELLFAINDRILTTDQTRIDYDAGIPHDYTQKVAGSDDLVGRPEFMGTINLVNAHPSPDLALERGTWRLRLLNTASARTYALALCDPDAIAARTGRVWYSSAIRVIGADGGLAGRSVALTDTEALIISPAQRRDLLIDLSGVPASVTRLELVNLALLPWLANTDPKTTVEAIYTTFDNTVMPPTNAQYDANDQALYDALAAVPIALVARANLAAAPAGATPAPNAAAIDAVLTGAAADDDFAWDGNALGRLPGVTLGPNRLVLLISNTLGLEAPKFVRGVSGFGDVQIFELTEGGSDWGIPFTVDLTTATEPAPGGPSAPRDYGLARRTFFAQEVNPDVTLAKAYPALHAPVISARGGTYERWYVANLNNSQPVDPAAGAADLHPFHIHLVNFVVLRRWTLDDNAQFVPIATSDLALDLIARQDTVQIPSNEMVELLVHYPAGYTGDYAYHCHILEHEDKCMMSHFHLEA